MNNNHSKLRRSVLKALMAPAALSLSPRLATASSFPNQPITLICPFGLPRRAFLGGSSLPCLRWDLNPRPLVDGEHTRFPVRG